MSPQTYTWLMTYNEKIDILMFLVDTIHDLDVFKQFLNRRLDEKTSLFKQKNDLHAEVKKIEQEKNEAISSFKSKNPDQSNEKLESEI